MERVDKWANVISRRLRIAATLFVPILVLAALIVHDSGASLLTSVVVAGAASVVGLCAGVWLSPVLNKPAQGTQSAAPSRRGLAVGVLVGLCATIATPDGAPLGAVLGVVAGFMAGMAYRSPKLADDQGATRP